MLSNRLTIGCGAFVLLCSVACGEHPHQLPESGAPSQPEPVSTFAAQKSWPICELLGPDAMRPGVYGSDLGMTAPIPNGPSEATSLAMLFGDTWAGDQSVCTYPVTKSDDLQATLPLQRPAILTPGAPSAAASGACSQLQYTQDDPSTFRPMRLFPDATSRDDSRVIDTSMLRTPAAAFSDGQHLFGMFIRQVQATCSASSDCPSGMLCSDDPAFSSPHPLGSCQPHVGLTDDAAPVLCLQDAGCSVPATCQALTGGVCLMPSAFPAADGGGPTWYSDDPRRAVAQPIYIASSFWPDRREDYATGALFVTNKFTNISARAIANFDFDHPENNDYRAGSQTLLVWGRPAWLGTNGFQPLMFLLAQPLANLLAADGSIQWAPKFFAGDAQDNRPQWSDSEVDAQPVYGAADWQEKPEFDVVNQFAVSYVEPLERFVLVYGGGTSDWIATDQATAAMPPIVHPQPTPGSMYMRSAKHPFGQLDASADPTQAWSDPVLLLSADEMKQYIACNDAGPSQQPCAVSPDANRPYDLVRLLDGLSTAPSPDQALAIGAMCLAGGLTLDAMYDAGDDSGGHLYGANVIDTWTQDVTDQVSGLSAGEHAVELYWNVSTWNPYSVVLVKSEVHGSNASVR
jgi:hypothetical protein